MRLLFGIFTKCFSPKHTILELEAAIQRHDRNTAKKCIERRVDLNSPSPKSGSTPLCLAIKAHDRKMMTLLISQGASLDFKFDCDWTALFLSCALGYLEGVTLLVEQGADTTLRSSTGLTCLMVAAKNGHLSVVVYLLEHGSCDVNAVGQDGYSTLHYVALTNDASTIFKLIHKGANIDAQTPDGSTAVFLATKHSKLNTLRTLLEAGAEPNISTRKGGFALHEAVTQGNVEVVKILIRHKADSTKIGKGGQTPLELAKLRESQNGDIYVLLKSRFAALSSEEVAWR